MKYQQPDSTASAWGWQREMVAEELTASPLLSDPEYLQWRNWVKCMMKRNGLYSQPVRTYQLLSMILCWGRLICSLEHGERVSLLMLICQLLLWPRLNCLTSSVTWGRPCLYVCLHGWETCLSHNGVSSLPCRVVRVTELLLGNSREVQSPLLPPLQCLITWYSLVRRTW